MATAVCALAIPGSALSNARPTVPVAVTQSDSGSQQRHVPTVAFGPDAPYASYSDAITVDDRRVAQELYGVGAALTNSAAFLIDEKLTSAAHDSLLDRLFGPGQANISIVRVPIGGSDFNVGGRRYSLDDLPPGQTDPQLRRFSMAPDAAMVRVLREALAINPDLRVIASPWSAPAWMKVNRSLTNLHHGGDLDRRWYPVYAAYLVRYLTEMRRRGIGVYALTVQNEPGVPASYEGMNLPPALESLFVRRYLRPALRRARLSTRVLGVDIGWDQVAYASRLVRDRAVDGLAWHCYAGTPDVAQARFSRVPQLMSECAPNLISAAVGPLIANELNDGGAAAILWNVVLDTTGGPVVLPNTGCRGCMGLATVDATRGDYSLEPAYRELAPFGRVIRPGAHRIWATRLGRFREFGNRATPTLHDVALRNPDGADVLIVANNALTTQRFAVRWKGLAFGYSLPRGALATFEWPSVGAPVEGQGVQEASGG